MRDRIALFLIFLIFIISTIYLKQDIIFEHLKELYIPFTPKPTISVLISSYNMGGTLPRAIDSIIAQTYTDWEIIIINDGSKDNTAKNLRKYRFNHKVRIFTNPKNIGFIPSLNKGYEKIRGKYIARLDADDYSYPDRLERSIELLEKENLDLVGSWCQEGNFQYNTKAKTYLNTLGIGLYLFVENNICQSSVLMKKDFLDKHNIRYNANYKNAEDYDFWFNVFLNGGKMAYLGGAPLSRYNRTLHTDSWFETQWASAKKIKTKALSKVIPNFDEKLLKKPLPQLMPYLIEGNKTTKIFDQKELIKCQKTKCYKYDQTLKQRL